MPFQQPMLHPGTAEYAINLYGQNLTCTHSPKYDLNREQNPRFPSRIAFFHINDQDVSYLDTKKLCVACCAAIMPEGFNVWSLLTTLARHYQGSPLPKRWLDTEPCISGNDGRFYPRLFEIGKEGRRSGFFQTLPNHIHIPQGFPEANDAWQWLQQQRKPFYTDQLHLAKGWKSAAQTAASLDSVIAEKHGLSFSVASAQVMTPRHQFGPPPPMRQPFLKPQQSTSPKHPLSPPAKHLHSSPPPKPQHSSPRTNQLPLAPMQPQPASAMADQWPRLQSQHPVSQLPPRKPVPKKLTQNPPSQSMQPLPLPAAKIQQSVPLRKPVNSSNRSGALLQPPLTQHAQSAPLQTLQSLHSPKIEQPSSQPASNQTSPSSRQVWHFYDDIPLETVSALLSRKATKSSTGSPHRALEQILQKLLSPIVTPSNSIQMGLTARLNPNPVSTDLTGRPRDALSVITAQIGVPGAAVGGKSLSSRTTPPNSTPAAQAAPRSVNMTHAQQIRTGARRFDEQKGIKPKKPQQASLPPSVSAYTHDVNGQSGSVQNTRPPRIERELSQYTYQSVPARKPNMSVQTRAFNQPQPLSSQPAENQIQRNSQNQQNQQTGRSSQPQARNQLAYSGQHWHTPKASNVNQSPSSHVHVWREPSSHSLVPQTQSSVFSHPKTSSEFLHTPKHWHSQAGQARSLPQPGTSETSQLSSKHPSPDNSAPNNDAALESTIRHAGTDNANANDEPEEANAKEEIQTTDPKHLADFTPNDQQNATNEPDSAATTAKPQPPGGSDHAAKDSTTEPTTSSESTSADAPTTSNQLDPTAPGENTNAENTNGENTNAEKTNGENTNAKNKTTSPSDPGAASGSTQTPKDQRVPEFEPLDTRALDYTPSAQSALSWSQIPYQPFQATASYGPGPTQPWGDTSTAAATPASQSQRFTDDDANNMYKYTNDTPPEWDYYSHLRSGRTSQHSKSGSTGSRSRSRSRSSASSEPLGSSFRSLSKIGRGSSSEGSSEGVLPSQRNVTEYGNSEFYHHGQLETLDGPDRDQEPRGLEPRGLEPAGEPNLAEPKYMYDEKLAFYDGSDHLLDGDQEREPEPSEPDLAEYDGSMAFYDGGQVRDHHQEPEPEPEPGEPDDTCNDGSGGYHGQYDDGLAQESEPNVPDATTDGNLEFYHGQYYRLDQEPEAELSKSVLAQTEDLGFYAGYHHDCYQEPELEPSEPDVTNYVNSDSYYGQSHGLDQEPEAELSKSVLAETEDSGFYAGHHHHDRYQEPELEPSEPDVTNYGNSDLYYGQSRGLDQEPGPGEPEDLGLYRGQLYHAELYHNRVEGVSSESRSSSEEEENHGLGIHDSYQEPQDEVYNPEAMEHGAAWNGDQINQVLPHDYYQHSHIGDIEVPHGQENMAYGQPEGVYGHEHEGQWDHPSPADEGEQDDVPGDSGFSYPSEVEGNEPWEGFGEHKDEHYEENGEWADGENGRQDYGARGDYHLGDGHNEAYDSQEEPEWNDQVDPQHYDNREQYGNGLYY